MFSVVFLGYFNQKTKQNTSVYSGEGQKYYFRHGTKQSNLINPCTTLLFIIFGL